MASSAPCILGFEGGDIDLLWALRLVGMLGAGIDAQVLQLLAAKRPARQHPLHCLVQHSLRMLALAESSRRSVP